MSNLTKLGLLILPATSFGLGVWQLKRLEWKKGLIRDIEERLAEEPIDLLQIESVKDLQNLEYRRVKVRGRFDQEPSHQLYLKPRQLQMNREAQQRGRSDAQSYIGVNVITPFQLDESNLRILVNRGWLSTRKGDRDHVDTDWRLGMNLENQSIELVGLLRSSDNKSTFGMRNNEQSNEWQIRDIPAMARVLRTAPILIEAEAGLSHLSGPIGGQTPLKIRNEHLNYAITWFSLAAIVTIMWYSKYGRSLRRIGKAKS